MSRADIQKRRYTTTGAEESRGRRNRILWVAVLAVGAFACYSSNDTKDDPDGASSTGAGTSDGDAGIERNNSGPEHVPDTGLSNTRGAGELADPSRPEGFDAQVSTHEGAGGAGDANQVPLSDGGASVAGDGGASGIELCGQLICPPGRSCCNPSCGICTGPGEICTKIECDEPIGPYLGSSCDPSACPPLATEVLTCEDGSLVRRGCVHREDGSCGYVESCPRASDAPCGGCRDDEYCEVSGCGSKDEQGVCTLRPQSCTRQYDPVCGCDYWTYDNSCMARLAGTDVYYQGECFF